MTAPKRPALERAIDLMQSARDNQAPFPLPPLAELRAVGPDLLREVADELIEERRTSGGR